MIVFPATPKPMPGFYSKPVALGNRNLFRDSPGQQDKTPSGSPVEAGGTIFAFSSRKCVFVAIRKDLHLLFSMSCAMFCFRGGAIRTGLSLWARFATCFGRRGALLPRETRLGLAVVNNDAAGRLGPLARLVEAGIGTDSADDVAGGNRCGVRRFDDALKDAGDVPLAAREEPGGMSVAVDGGTIGNLVFLGDRTGLPPIEEVLLDGKAIGVAADIATAPVT
jgi:hypothetical protein